MIFFCFYSLTISISMYCIYIRAIFANDILYGFSCHTSSYPHSHTHPHSPVLSSGQSLPTAYCTVSHVTHPLTLSLIHIHSYTSIIRAIFANGILHGFSWDGAPSLAPALAMTSWRAGDDPPRPSLTIDIPPCLSLSRPLTFPFPLTHLPSRILTLTFSFSRR